MTDVRVTAPAVVPIKLAEVKAHLRITQSVEDDLITEYIAQACALIEANYDLAFATQQWQLVLAEFPKAHGYNAPRRGAVTLSKGPVVSVDAVVYTDTAGNVQTLDNALYTLERNTISGVGRIHPVYGTDWSEVNKAFGAVTVSYTAGFVDTSVDPIDYSTLPLIVKRAVGLIVGDFVENRENTSDKALYEIPLSADSLLLPYHRY